MDNIIACRLVSYGKFADRAWTHLGDLGVRHVEIDVPPDDRADEIQKKLEDHGLIASSMTVKLDIQDAKAVDAMRSKFATGARLGTSILFTSVRRGDVEESIIWERLRRLGACAGEHEITVVLETHPDLLTNAQVGLRTMQQVDHPRIRVNFDTANIHYYNHDVDTVDQLSQIIDFVAAVHLKDSGGGYRRWDFPTLGQGIVDFPQVFQVLKQRGFLGPYTVELEGNPQVDATDEASVLKYVSDSFAYLRTIGVMA